VGGVCGPRKRRALKTRRPSVAGGNVVVDFLPGKYNRYTPHISQEKDWVVVGVGKKERGEKEKNGKG
jgi:hypothetical protein